MTIVGVIEAAITYGLGLAFAGRLVSLHRASSKADTPRTSWIANSFRNTFTYAPRPLAFRLRTDLRSLPRRSYGKEDWTAERDLTLTASVAFGGTASQSVRRCRQASATTERKDLQVFNDVAKSVNRYTHFTIFDDVNAKVNDGVVTSPAR